MDVKSIEIFGCFDLIMTVERSVGKTCTVEIKNGCAPQAPLVLLIRQTILGNVKGLDQKPIITNHRDDTRDG